MIFICFQRLSYIKEHRLIVRGLRSEIEKLEDLEQRVVKRSDPIKKVESKGKIESYEIEINGQTWIPRESNQLWF